MDKIDLIFFFVVPEQITISVLNFEIKTVSLEWQKSFLLVVINIIFKVRNSCSMSLACYFSFRYIFYLLLTSLPYQAVNMEKLYSISVHSQAIYFLSNFFFSSTNNFFRISLSTFDI